MHSGGGSAVLRRFAHRSLAAAAACAAASSSARNRSSTDGPRLRLCVACAALPASTLVSMPHSALSRENAVFFRFLFFPPLPKPSFSYSFSFYEIPSTSE